MDAIEARRDHQSLKIYINTLLHIEIRMEHYRGFQSWFEGSGGTKKSFYAEFYLSDGDPILVEYDDRETWERVLRLVDENV